MRNSFIEMVCQHNFFFSFRLSGEDFYRFLGRKYSLTVHPGDNCYTRQEVKKHLQPGHSQKYKCNRSFVLSPLYNS